MASALVDAGSATQVGVAYVVQDGGYVARILVVREAQEAVLETAILLDGERRLPINTRAPDHATNSRQQDELIWRATGVCASAESNEECKMAILDWRRIGVEGGIGGPVRDVCLPRPGC